MRRPATILRRLYGAGPLHLLLMLAGFAVAGYALTRIGLDGLWNPDTWWQSIGVWFLGAVVAHDLVLFPLYAAVDRAVLQVHGWPRRAGTVPDRPPLANHVRFPLLAGALVTLIFFPGVIRQGGDTYQRATGLTQHPFLARWLWLLAAFALISGLLYVLRRVAAARRTR